MTASTTGALDYLHLTLGLAALSALTVLSLRWAGVRLGLFPEVVLLRAALQLRGEDALLLQGILTSPGEVAAFVVLMLTTASLTSVRRIRGLWHGLPAAIGGVVVGSLIALGLVFGLGLVDLATRNILAVGGIVIGGSMSAATLTGRTFLRSSIADADRIEAGWPWARHRGRLGPKSLKKLYANRWSPPSIRPSPPAS